jgi:hypothetical protein
MIAQEQLDAQQQLKTRRFQNAGRQAEYQLKSYRQFLLDQQVEAGGSREKLEGWRATQMDMYEARTSADLMVMSPTGNEETNYAMASYALGMAIAMPTQAELPPPNEGEKVEFQVRPVGEFVIPPFKPDDELGPIIEQPRQNLERRRNGHREPRSV